MFSAEFRAQQDLDLDKARKDKRLKSEFSPKMKVLYQPSQTTALYAEVELDYERDLYAERWFRKDL